MYPDRFAPLTRIGARSRRSFLTALLLAPFVARIRGTAAQVTCKTAGSACIASDECCSGRCRGESPGAVGACTKRGPAPGSAPVSSYRIVAEYPHDPAAFTQGLVFVDGALYEGTGLRGESTLRRVELETGEVLQSTALDPNHFGEGIAVVGDRVYQLTWKNRTGIVYDRETFEALDTFTYPTEGWGLTTDGARLIHSDGTNRLYFRDPDTFAELSSIDVFHGGQPIGFLNELEFVEGEIWANIWRTDFIARIDPATGQILAWIDLSGLLSEADRQAYNVDVLNGIAYDSATGRIFVTGKWWPKVFEIELA
jgi:glutamine cyclotransferase